MAVGRVPLNKSVSTRGHSLSDDSKHFYSPTLRSNFIFLAHNTTT